ncbi:MAG: trigger factor [Clostridia bacterium]|nr:trigger factor [Clostridia bacterium]
MTLKNITNPEKNVTELEFIIEKEVFDAAVDKQFKKNAPKMNIPGFRRGKAPRSIIEKMYGKGVFYEDALNDVLPAAYEAALAESKAEAVSRPEFDVDSIDENGVVVKAKFYVKPEVTIDGYKGIEAERTLVPVTDADVDAEINTTRERNSRLVDVTDRAAQLEDTVVIDFEGFVDGVAFDGGKGEKFNLRLGSGQFIPGFEDQIVGHNIGDEFDVNVEFPAEYHAADLAGKPAVFKVKLHEIKFNELPALDDEFAKDVSEFDTLDEYKADVKAKLEAKNTKTADNEVEEKLINTLIDNLGADIPEAMFVTETENFLRDYDSRLRMQGLDLNTYFKYTGMDLDTLRAQFRPQAERQVKTRLALEKIAELEAIEATEEDIEAEFNRLAAAYNMPADQIKATIAAEDLAKDIKVQKAVDLVKSSAVVTDKAPEAAE